MPDIPDPGLGGGGEGSRSLLGLRLTVLRVTAAALRVIYVRHADILRREDV